MYFNHPWLLFGLLAVLIPVIIHLFNFRRYKKLYFSNISFLKNITTQTRKQNKLKHLIVLILRIIAIMALVVAFAGPVLKKKTGAVLPDDVVTIIYIDNSFSMLAEGENGRLFEEAVNKARNLAGKSAPDASFLLLTNESSPSQQRILSKEEILDAIENVAISAENQSINAVVNRAKTIIDDKDLAGHEIYLFSDYQRNSFDVVNFVPDSNAFHYLLPLKHLQKRNIYIDSCWLTDPVLIANRRITVNVRLRNSSDIDYEKIPLKLWVNEEQKAVAGVDIVAGSHEIVTLSFTARQTGWHYAKLEIEDYPITFDDRLYFTFNVKKDIKVLEIADISIPGYLSLFYGSDSLFEYDLVDYQRVQYDDFNSYNLIILNSLPSISSGLISQLQPFVEAGGNLLFIPNTNKEKTTENQLLGAFNAGQLGTFDATESRVVGIKKEHILFKDAIQNIPENADLPDVFGHFKYNYHVNSGVETLISLLNGDAFFGTKKYGKGRIYLFTTSIDQTHTNFISHPLFVPVMYGVGIEGEIHTSLYHILGVDKKITLNTITSPPGSDKTFKVVKHKEDFETIPEQQFMKNGLLIDFHGNISTDGFYELLWDNNLNHVLAFNYNRLESELEFYSEEELRKQIEEEKLFNFRVLSAGNVGYLEMLNTVEKESQLWKLFIIFALLMLLAEALVLRFWK
jgi:hypothetical protein